MLEKSDLEEIKKVVQDSEKRLTKKIEGETSFLAKITKEGFDIVDKRFEKVDERFDDTEGQIGHIVKHMVTKEYFDEEIQNLKGELVVRINRQDSKFNILVDLLLERKVISKRDVARIDAVDVSVAPK